MIIYQTLKFRRSVNPASVGTSPLELDLHTDHFIQSQDHQIDTLLNLDETLINHFRKVDKKIDKINDVLHDFLTNKKNENE